MVISTKIRLSRHHHNPWVAPDMYRGMTQRIVVAQIQICMVVCLFRQGV